MFPAAVMEEDETARQKGQRNKIAVAPSPPATADPKPEPPVPPAPEPLSFEVAAAWIMERKRKKQEVGTVSPWLKQVNPYPTPSDAAGASIMDGVDKGAAAAAERAMEQKKRRRVETQQQSGHLPVPVDIHLHGREEAVEGPKGKKKVKTSSRKKSGVLSDRELIRMRLELRKKQPLPEGIVAFTEMVTRLNPNSTSSDHNPNFSSPVAAFFDQFRYKPDRQQDRNAPSHPKTGTPDRPARSLPRGHPSLESSQLSTKEISRAAKTTTLIDRQTSSVSTSVSQKKVQVDENPEKKKKNRKKNQRKPKYSLTREEKWSDMYRRISLDQLVPPPHSPHRLLQEKYASDPWKVIVICMLLNVTQGQQVRKKLKGFFKRYPDAQTVCDADVEKMAKYLAPLGLQRRKSMRIKRFSEDYIGKQWTYITELCGVGKYAADAYAIFCAGKATEVVPLDHKLVDYWKYVCFQLPLIQGSQNVPEPDARELGDLVPNKLL